MRPISGRITSSRAVRERKCPRPRWYPCLVRLEDRTAPAIFTWTGADNAYWDDADNWLEGKTPDTDPNADIVFPGVAQNLVNINNFLAIKVRTLTYDGTGYVTDGQGLTLKQGITVTANHSATLMINLKLDAAQVFSVETGAALTFSDKSTLGGSGSAELTKKGDGVLSLLGNNNYLGGTQLEAGTIAVSGSLALGAGKLKLIAGTLENAGTSSQVTNAFQVDGPVTIRPGDSFIFSGPGNIGANGEIVSDVGMAIFTDIISGPGDVRVVGDVILNAANNYSGDTRVAGGTLFVGNNSAAGSGILYLESGRLEALVAVNISNAFSVPGPAVPTVGGPITLGGPGIIAAGASLTVEEGTIAGGITGDGALTVAQGIVVLTGANTYAGDTNITSGSLRLGADQALPFGATVIVAASATLDLAGFDADVGELSGGGDVRVDGSILRVGIGDASSELSGQILGSGRIEKLGAGELTLTGLNLFTGGTTLYSGTIVVGSNLALGVGTVTLNGGTLTVPTPVGVANPMVVNTAASISSDANVVFSKPITLNGGAILTVTNADKTVTITGQITGPGALTKIGEGTLAIFGTNTYSGDTTLADGVLAVSRTSPLGTGTLNLVNGRLRAVSVIIPNAYIVTGNVQFAGLNTTMILSGVGTMTGGSLNVNSKVQVNLSHFVQQSGRLNIGSGAAIGKYIFNDGFLTGPGSVVLLDVTWAGGTMSGAGSSIIPSNGTLEVTASDHVSINDRTVTNQGKSSWPGQGGIWIGGTGKVTNTQTGKWSNNNGNKSFTSTGGAPRFENLGLVEVTGAGLVVGAGIEFTNTGTIALDAGTFHVIEPFANAGNISIGAASVFTATGNFVQTAGTTTLAGGVLTVPLLVDIQGGTLSGFGTVNGNVLNRSRVTVGNIGVAGVLSINGDYTQTAVGVLAVELDDINASNPSDRLNVTGNATLDGTLNVALLPGFVATLNDAYQVLTGGSVTGVFASYNLPNLGGGLFLDPVYSGGGLQLIVSS